MRTANRILKRMNKTTHPLQMFDWTIWNWEIHLLSAILVGDQKRLKCNQNQSDWKKALIRTRVYDSDFLTSILELCKIWCNNKWFRGFVLVIDYRVLPQLLKGNRKTISREIKLCRYYENEEEYENTTKSETNNFPVSNELLPWFFFWMIYLSK